MSKKVDFLKEYSWINNKDLFERILQEKYDTNSIVLKSFTCDEALPEGGNYRTQILRVKLFYSFSTNENVDIVCRSFIIKTGVCDTLEENNVFLKEIAFYRNIIPHLYRILDEKVIGTVLAPRCFAADCNPLFMIFEDLMKKGYKNVSEQQGLNYDHLELCLSKLSKFHAATAHYGFSDPPELNIFKRPLLTTNTTEFFPFFQKPLRCCAEMCATWPGFEKISTKLFTLETVIIEKVVNMYKKSKFNVIIHGDLWVNNLMYSYDKDEEPVDVIMIDHCSGYWGSPSIDIAYLFYSSSSNDIGDMEWCQLIDHYHRELVNNLSVLRYPGYIPTLDDINEEIAANSPPIIAITALLTGLRFLENSEDYSFQSMMGDSNIMIKVMSTHTFKNRMKFLLPYYDSKGFLD